jgi:probable rRNA maturation factor
LEIDIVEGAALWRGHEDCLADALSAAAAMTGAKGQVALLLGDDAALSALNKEFRGKDGPTNVLSFPAPKDDPAAAGFLGDIALAGETVVNEARDQGKRFEHHAAHLAIHGFLHLLGYDHETSEADAAAMEELERKILANVGIADPYA